MSGLVVSSEDKPKLEALMKAAKAELQEIDDRKGALRDLVKGLAQELGLEPRQLMGAVRSAYKGDIEEKKEDMLMMEGILEIAGEA